MGSRACLPCHDEGDFEQGVRIVDSILGLAGQELVYVDSLARSASRTHGILTKEVHNVGRGDICKSEPDVPVLGWLLRHRVNDGRENISRLLTR